MLVAFYYLLQVGEYTKPKFAVQNGKQVPAARTQKIVVRNMGFFENGKTLKRNAPLAKILTADLAVLKITNQKNGRMGQTITQHATSYSTCPVKVLAHIVHNIVSLGSNYKTLLCAVHNGTSWQDISSAKVVSMVRQMAQTLKLQEQAIDPNLIGEHLLRAGDAMALKLQGYNDTTIMKMGRWRSLTFLQYIHNQIAHLSKDISTKMRIPLLFVNIAAFA